MSSETTTLMRITAAVTAAALLGACAGRPAAERASTTSTDSPATATPAPTSSPAAAAPPATAAPKTQTWTALQAGDCLAAPPPSDPAVVTVSIVDCAGPHSAETFLRANIPVNAAVTDTATATCEAGLTAYTGRPSAGSGYTIAYLIDSDQDRTSNNPFPSTVICLLQGPGGAPLTGSARG